MKARKWLLWTVMLSLSAAAVSHAGEEQLRQAERALEAGDFSAAMDGFEKALAVDPNSLRGGNGYRLAVIGASTQDKTVHDRCIEFFQGLVKKNPQSANAFLNFGFAYVDKIPAAGSISQVLLARDALLQFDKSLEIRPSWIGYYTRGNAYLFWPPIFGRTPLGIADLEQALRMQSAGKVRPYHVRTYVAIGDGHFRIGETEEAKQYWTQGLQRFPRDPELRARLSLDGERLKALVDERYDPNKRVDTNLKELWSQP